VRKLRLREAEVLIWRTGGRDGLQVCPLAISINPELAEGR
jgi:hypothetical protein